jgi:hypothetical protein
LGFIGFCYKRRKGGRLQEEGLQYLLDRRVELVDLRPCVSDDRQAEVGGAAWLNRGRLHAVHQAGVNTVLLEKELQELGAQVVRGRHVLLGDGADVAGSGDDQGSEDGAGALHVWSLEVALGLPVQVFTWSKSRSSHF